ncbi:hypothetical protein [Aeromicrobium massiliense]|nr:hypothetical protein [Aeromicrobium massiliense]
MSEMWRWIVGVLVLVLVISLVAVARGDDHRRGDDVGAVAQTAPVSG